MLKALREARGLDAVRAGEVLRLAKIDPDLRPEAVDVAGFVRLLDVLSPAVLVRIAPS